jgi:hypothetical protein
MEDTKYVCIVAEDISHLPTVIIKEVAGHVVVQLEGTLDVLHAFSKAIATETKKLEMP